MTKYEAERQEILNQAENPAVAKDLVRKFAGTMAASYARFLEKHPGQKKPFDAWLLAEKGRRAKIPGLVKTHLFEAAQKAAQGDLDGVSELLNAFAREAEDWDWPVVKNKDDAIRALWMFWQIAQ